MREERFEDFFLEQEDLCYSLNEILRIIKDHLDKSPARPAFSKTYPNELENAMNMSWSFARDVLKLLASEARQVSNARSSVRDYLLDYRDGRRGQDFGTEGTPDYRKLPDELKQLVDRCVANL